MTGPNRGRVRRPRGHTATVAIIVAVAVIAGALPAAGGCARAPEEPLALRVPWVAGEISVLTIQSAADGRVVGTWELRVEAADPGPGWVLSSFLSAEGFEERSSVRVGRDDLLPARVDYELRTADGTATYTALYAAGKATLTADVSGKRQEATVKLPDAPYFDNEQFVTTLRALPLAEGWSRALNDIVTRNATKARITVAVTGEEEVDSPAGTFRCWVVELKGIGQTAWIAVEPPHQLVQYRNAQSGLVMKLADYSASGE